MGKCYGIFGIRNLRVTNPANNNQRSHKVDVISKHEISKVKSNKENRSRHGFEGYPPSKPCRARLFSYFLMNHISCFEITTGSYNLVLPKQTVPSLSTSLPAPASSAIEKQILSLKPSKSRRRKGMRLRRRCPSKIILREQSAAKGGRRRCGALGTSRMQPKTCSRNPPRNRCKTRTAENARR